MHKGWLSCIGNNHLMTKSRRKKKNSLHSETLQGNHKWYQHRVHGT
jgi:hypothetical protein